MFEIAMSNTSQSACLRALISDVETHSSQMNRIRSLSSNHAHIRQIIGSK